MDGLKVTDDNYFVDVYKNVDRLAVPRADEDDIVDARTLKADLLQLYRQKLVPELRRLAEPVHRYLQLDHISKCFGDTEDTRYLDAEFSRYGKVRV